VDRNCVPCIVVKDSFYRHQKGAVGEQQRVLYGWRFINAWLRQS